VRDLRRKLRADITRLTAIMHGRRRMLAAASTAIVLSVASVPALAQSNAVRVRTTPAAAALSATSVVRSPAVIGAYVERVPAAALAATPDNLTVPSNYRTTIAGMLERSPMFRRQCLRLAAATQLSVVVRMLHPLDGGPRARTAISREDHGRLHALVEINPVGDFTELLAHELEHVIEQLDGVDLAGKAALAESGVRNCPGGFETRRAARVGTLVALEVRDR
jgi:hypothetical protein